MSQVGKIKLKSLSDLVEPHQPKENPENVESNTKATKDPPQRTPLKRRSKTKNQAAETLSTKTASASVTPTKKIKVVGAAATTGKKATQPRTSKKEPPPNQQRIDSFFKSSSKSYRIEPDTRPTVCSVSGKENNQRQATNKAINSSAKKRGNAKTKTTVPTAARGKVRKRLYEQDGSTSETETMTSLSCLTPPPSKAAISRKRKTPVKKRTPPRKSAQKPEVCIDLCSDSEEELQPIKEEPLAINENAQNPTPEKKLKSPQPMVSIPSPILKESSPRSNSPTYSTSNDTSNSVVMQPPPIVGSTRSRNPRPCPAYKIVAGTTFAVDAFQFGSIERVTHYFLTHFHADHYIGLTRKFAMPLYMSPITARLVRVFIPLEEQYLHEIDLQKPQVIEGVEVTAIDANHCPGAVMFIFKFSTGKCILHTGDFRACPDMESEPIFWNNDIDTIYLDTTYLSDRYDFCTQWESIDSAKMLVHQFRERHANKRILYVCGSYTIGKEKFWGALAEEFKLSIWTDGNRRKALEAMTNVGDSIKNSMLCENPLEANMHVIAMGKLGYLSLVEYFEPFASYFDILLAIRPSGWEKHSKPKYGKVINILGVEYSEHSSHNELQRFVSYLKPREVISTVPVGRDLAVTANVPLKWYKYDKLRGTQRNYQPSITSYLKLNTKSVNKVKNTSNKLQDKSALVTNMSPLKLRTTPTLPHEVVDISADGSVDAVLQDSSFKGTPNAVAGSTPRLGFNSDAVSDWLS